MWSLYLDLKIIFSLQYGKSRFIFHLYLVLKSNESLPKYGKIKVNSLFVSFQINCLQKICWWCILLFQTKDHVEKFKNYLNKQHKNIKFTSEIEENGSLLFLDITITREIKKFETSVYRKLTISGVFTNFESFIPKLGKRGLIETLLYRSFRLCSI